MDDLIFESIKEELGVSDEITKVTDEISNIISENVEKQPKMKLADGIQTNTFKFKHNVFNTVVSFEFKNNYFSDVKIYFAYRKKYGMKPNKYIPDTNTIRIETDYINGWHDPEALEGALQHELEHLFQDFNAGYSREKTKQYNLAAGNFNNQNNAVQLISKAIYYSEERELYAFANQAYQFLMRIDSDPREEIKNTKIYSGYGILKDALEFLRKNVGNKSIDSLLSKFGTTNRKLSEHCRWAVKEYAKYIGRVIVKTEKDKTDNSIQEGVDLDF